MPRSTIGNRRATPFDKKLELRDFSAAAIAATTAETAIEFASDKFFSYKVVVDCAVHSGYAAGSAFWEIVIEIATTQGGTYSKVGSAVLIGTQARFDVPLSGSWAEDLLPGAAWIRARAVKTGAPGNLTYGAFITLPE